MQTKLSLKGTACSHVCMVPKHIVHQTRVNQVRHVTYAQQTPGQSVLSSAGNMLATAAIVGSLLLSPMAICQPAAAAPSTIEAVLTDYADMLASGKSKNAKVLEEFRAKNNVKRLMDGRVQVKRGNGEMLSVRLDLQMPGVVLLRAQGGEVYGLQAGSLKQVDLSDDMVVLMLFSDGQWEQAISPVETEDDKGKIQTLKMTEQEFREIVSLLGEDENVQ